MVSSKDARTAIAQLILDKIRQDTYPSYTHMAIFEEVAPRELAGDYLEVLLAKVKGDRNPSIPMLRHIAQLSAQLG